MSYVDLTADARKFIMTTDSIKRQDGILMSQTVHGNNEGFTPDEVQCAHDARDVQAKMAHPSDEMLKHVVSSTNTV